MRRWASLAVAASLAVPVVAEASAGETEWRAGLGASPASRAAVGVELGWLHNLTDFWSLGVNLRDRRLVAALPDGRVAVTADARFVVDALTWIPAVDLGFGGALANGGTTGAMQAFVHADVSLGYRPARNWGVSLHVGADRYGGVEGEYIGTVAISYVWYRGSGIGLDL